MSRDAAELRRKESDRIDVTVKNLRAMGAEVQEFEDGLAVHGQTQLRGAMLDSYATIAHLIIKNNDMDMMINATNVCHRRRSGQPVSEIRNTPTHGVRITATEFGLGIAPQSPTVSMSTLLPPNKVQNGPSLRVTRSSSPSADRPQQSNQTLQNHL